LLFPLLSRGRRVAARAAGEVGQFGPAYANSDAVRFRKKSTDILL
jgi:hypothetical protein